MELNPRSLIIHAYPIGACLDPFYNVLIEGCAKAGIEPTADAFDQLDQVELGAHLAYSLTGASAARCFPSNYHKGHSFQTDLYDLRHNVYHPQFDRQRLKPLFSAVVAHIRNDFHVWDEADKVVEYSIYICGGKIKAYDLRANLGLELNTLYVDVPDLFSTILTGINGLETVSTSFFEKCTRDCNPRFQAEVGWTSWPTTMTKSNLMRWLTEFTDQLANHIDDMGSIPGLKKKLVVEPANNIENIIRFLKTNVCFTYCRDDVHSYYQTSRFLVVGTLRCDPNADSSLVTWTELVSSVKEVFFTQYFRRFALGFTLCGSIMRIWLFDRTGGVASQSFDINKDGKQFVDIMAAFLLMDSEQLGLDPTLMQSDSQVFIDINRNGVSERIVIDQTLYDNKCIAGCATKCWRGHLEGHPEMTLVIKDSWRSSKRHDVGQMLRKLTERGIPYVARYYHHEAVHLNGFADSTQDNVRKGLDVSKSKSRHLNQNLMSESDKYHGLENIHPEMLSEDGLLSSKTTNRIHHRLIMRDDGKRIHEAESPSILLNALVKCIRGHEELFKAGILHRNISLSNLIVAQDGDSSSWPAFIIDFETAIEVDKASNSERNVGTKPFMAVGVLLGQEHTFMHDLESFFWVLFWICIHVTGPGKYELSKEQYHSWFEMRMSRIAMSKVQVIANDQMFLHAANQDFSAYLRPLVPWVNKLRILLFPEGASDKREDLNVYNQMCSVLEEAAFSFRY
ncbi:hypothetical protein Cpir12675_006230 [Ceratocystis pirilliformis]|uniref:Fungal-type protein kinase domain-containing protein n=1 Tax=Ceratocystis pirilliformis TaxID=259994 RepID=A0ABR3YIZ7_9PEZI